MLTPADLATRARADGVRFLMSHTVTALRAAAGRIDHVEASDAEVERAARSARVLTFAAGLPQGLDTPVGEGGHGLSGGQAQRVAIARAFLKDAPLLLLDEPTAHLDPATEADVLDSLRRLTLNRTVILATHSVQAQAFGGRRIDLAAGGTAPAVPAPSSPRASAAASAATGRAPSV